MHHLPSFWADIAGAAFTILLLLAFGATGNDPWGLGRGGFFRKPQTKGAKGKAPVRAMLMGKDARISTSKTTAFAWTLVIVYILATTALIVIVEDLSFDDLVKPLSDGYLLLLGGPFAALVLAKGVTVTRINNGSLAKPEAADPVFSLSDLTSDDSGQTDLVDFQFLLFNALALAYVLVKFTSAPHSGLPELPTAFAGLTSLSALTYTANKAIAGSTPTVNSAGYDAATGIASIVGLNFTPADTTLRFNATAVAVLTTSANQLQFKVPTGTPAGTYPVTVSVPSGAGRLSVETSIVIPAEAP